ncbi:MULTISPECIES: DUF6153 family protein [Streptomyces]|uniref:Putative membrane protein n=5 Tax=Streptomyces scabiei TaxID=1930 RepID=C9Z1M6_STRSW|nr:MULTISPECIES: DUF6153 family protein [Streptomyces]MBP5865718.1 hypothetical protein [Streptomyces sp. LBUM 1484]MBP5933812.1 hypothetical protein [Streptomyces sp. LBUM 1479]KFG04239.1 hypothetical protein IQ61_36885 [Streptomyces scabiei]MBP5873566.1 hypothetical protein [Streptomyces sp. LBUM 1477]MBP5881263.1 hypothetical protein [Streptomyces sp. LBUM 1487]
MPGRPFRRTALPCVRGRSARLLLVIVSAVTTFLLSCAGSPPGEAPAQRPHTVSAEPRTQVPLAVRAGQVDRDPCEHRPGGHDCHSPDPAAVLVQVPSPGADHTAASWQPATAAARVASAGAREPGRARPPDLHELQLLRV